MTRAQVETFPYPGDLPLLASDPRVQVATALLECDECGCCCEQSVDGPAMGVYRITYQQWGRSGFWTDVCEEHSDEELAWLLQPRAESGRPRNVTLLVPRKLLAVAS